jgi:hypothetical protein
MAVEDKYINADIVADKKANAAFAQGTNTVSITETFEVAAADDDGSIYRLFKGLNPELIPSSIVVTNDAITAGTDYDIGFYETDLGPVIDKDALADALDLSSQHVEGSGLSGLVTVDVANVKKKIWELAGHTESTKKLGYDIAFTANTVGTAAGTVSVKATFLIS